MWLGLLAVAVHYALEWQRRREQKGPIPSPVRHPAILLLRALRAVLRIWPLAVLLIVLPLAHSITALRPPAPPKHSTTRTSRPALEAGGPQVIVQGESGARSLELYGVRGFVALRTGDPFWVLEGVLFPFTGKAERYGHSSPARVGGLGAEGPIAILIALCGWIAIWDPWRLGRHARTITAVVSLCSVAGFALQLVLYQTFSTAPFQGWQVLSGLGMLLLLPTASAMGAILNAALWHAVARHDLRPQSVARTALACFPVSLSVMTLSVLPTLLLVFPLSIIGTASGWLSQLLIAVNYPVMLLTWLIPTIFGWALWIAADRRRPAWWCLGDCLRLLVRSPGRLALMLLRLAVPVLLVMLAVELVVAALGMAGPLHWLVPPFRTVVGLWGLAVSACAYKSFAYEMRLKHTKWRAARHAAAS